MPNKFPTPQPRVFVAHNTRHPLAEAEKFGRLVMMTAERDPYPANDADDPDRKDRILDDFMFNIEAFDPATDHLLLVGDPIYCGLLLRLAAEKAERVRGPVTVNVLRWDKQLRTYIPVKVVL